MSQHDNHAWRQFAFGELFQIKHGYAFKGEFFADSGPYILLTPGNFEAEGGLQLKGEREKCYVGDVPDEFLLSRGDLLVVMTDLKQDAPILGSSAFIPQNNKFLHNQRLGKIVDVDMERLDIRYLYYLFNWHHVRGQIKATATGSTVRHTSPSRIYEVTARIPPPETQRKIAAILSAYDDLIENNTQRIRILEEMAQALYREWFVHFRFPGHEDVPLVESELGPIPQGWEVVTFTAIADVLSGGTPRTTVSEYWNGGIPFFSPKDAGDAFYVLATEREISELGLRKCNSSLYPRDTVFITARGTVGKVRLAAAPMAMNQSCYALVGHDGINQYYVFLCILEAVNQLQQQAHGAVFDTIIVDTFQRLLITKPPQPTIETFTSIILPIFNQILVLMEKNAAIRETRDLLLPRLVSGEIDVSELDIELGELETHEPQQS